MGIDMAAKKSGGLGRDFNFILEDNMPINVESPRNIKKRVTKKEPIKQNQSKINASTSSHECNMSSIERINKPLPNYTDESNVPSKVSTKQIPNKNSIDRDMLKKNILALSTTDNLTAKPDSTARKAAIASLRKKINATLRNEEEDKTNDNGEVKEYHSPLVKLKLEKTQKEGNNYVKAEKRTWS